MDRLEFFEDGKVAFTYITGQDQEEVNAVPGDHEGIVDVGKNIEYVDVASIAIMLGGGGHLRAAGAYGKGTIEQIRDKVLKEVRKQLK